MKAEERTKRLRWICQSAIVLGLTFGIFFSFVVPIGPVFAIDKRTELLERMALSRINDSTFDRIVRWASKPTINVTFLFDPEPVDIQIVKDQAAEIQDICKCIGQLNVKTGVTSLSLVDGQVEIVIDRQGYGRFLDRADPEIQSLFGPVEQVLREFPRHSDQAITNKFKALFSYGEVIRAVSVLSLNAKPNSLRSGIVSAFMLGLNPALSQSEELFWLAIEKTNSSTGKYLSPTSLGLENLRLLYDDRIQFGMTKEQLRAVSW